MKIKVYGLTVFIRGLPKDLVGGNGNTQKRVIMATTSWKKFSQTVNVSLSHTYAYGSVTGNEAEIKWCMANPEQAFYEPDHPDYPPFLPYPKE